LNGYEIEQGVLTGDTQIDAGAALVLVERGVLRAWLAPDEPVRLGEADVLILAGGEPARLSAGRKRAHAISFRVQGEWLARALALAGLEPGSALPRAATLRAGSHAARQAALHLRELAARAHEPSGPPLRLAHCAAAMSLLAITFVARSDGHAEAPRQRRSAARLALADALGALAREPRDGLTLPRLAERLQLSERQASRLVHERLGRSLGEHVTELRIARAKQLLAHSDLAVIEVAAEAGFGSLGHFNQVFRSRSGGTPSAFRAAAQQRAQATGGAADQPAVPKREEASDAGSGRRDTLASPRSSRFAIASTHAASETLPS
jgi:AraC-like DNA-binding protein